MAIAVNRTNWTGSLHEEIRLIMLGDLRKMANLLVIDRIYFHAFRRSSVDS